MAFKIILLAALVVCSQAAYSHQPQSAASPGQIAFAMSQNYDQTGPGAHLPLVQQETSTNQQDYTTQQQVFPQQQYSQLQSFQQQPSQQQAYQQQPQAYTIQHQYSGQQEAYNSQPQVYSAPPQAYVSQPQIYATQSQHYPQISQAPQQVAYAHPSPSYAPSTPQVSFSQVTQEAYQPQAGPVSYSATPQIIYSSSPHMAYPAQSQSQPQQVLKPTPLKPVQHEVYEQTPEYSYQYNNQHAVQTGEAKGQEELSQGQYTLVVPEGYQEHSNEYSTILKKQKPYKGYVGVPQPQTYFAPPAKPVYTNHVAQQYYAAPAVSKNEYSSPNLSQNSLFNRQKSSFTSYISKLSSPLHQQ